MSLGGTVRMRRRRCPTWCPGTCSCTSATCPRRCSSTSTGVPRPRRWPRLFAPRRIPAEHSILGVRRVAKIHAKKVASYNLTNFGIFGTGFAWAQRATGGGTL
eukprot:2431382-Pyramimonas_sp.AAC.1